MDHGDDNAFPGAGGFHRSEAISAVQDDEQYYGEDDDFDDLYNDVNVGEGFQQSLQRSEDAGGYQAVEEQRRDPPPSSPVPTPSLQSQGTVAPPETVQIPSAGVDPKVEASADRSGGFHNARFRPDGESAAGIGQAVPPPPQPSMAGAISGVRPDLGQTPSRPPQIQGPNGNNSFHNEGFQRQGAILGNDGIQRQPGGPGVGPGVNINGSGGLGVGGSHGATLFVGELLWWTTDAQLEAELCKYGQVKEIRFFDEKASGKSKGYCQVDFYDPIAAASCKEGMNGHVFNGRPCVVALASPQTVRRMGENQVNRNQQGAPQTQSQALAQKGRGGGAGPPVGGNYGRGGAGTGDGGGRGGGGGGGGNWGRGGGMGGRGPMGNMRNRMGPVGGRGMMNGGMVPPPPHMMLGQAFDPTGYGAAMGRMGAGYGGFPPGPAGGPFPGMMHPFQPVVAPHVNPAFFGRGMAPAGVGMWSDPNMGGWGGEEQSSYGEDAASDHQYGEGSHGKDRVPDRDRSGGSERRHEREKDLGHGQEWSDRRYRDERETGRDREIGRERDREWDRDRDREKERERDRDRYRDERDRHGDNYRHREREPERDDEWDRGRSSKPRSKSREIEYGKRRRPSHE